MSMAAVGSTSVVGACSLTSLDTPFRYPAASMVASADARALGVPGTVFLPAWTAPNPPTWGEGFSIAPRRPEPRRSSVRQPSRSDRRRTTMFVQVIQGKVSDKEGARGADGELGVGARPRRRGVGRLDGRRDRRRDAGPARPVRVRGGRRAPTAPAPSRASGGPRPRRSSTASPRSRTAPWSVRTSGDPDQAGFVQIMQGQVRDSEHCRAGRRTHVRRRHGPCRLPSRHPRPAARRPRRRGVDDGDLLHLGGGRPRRGGRRRRRRRWRSGWPRCSRSRSARRPSSTCATPGCARRPDGRDVRRAGALTGQPNSWSTRLSPSHSS